MYNFGKPTESVFNKNHNHSCYQTILEKWFI